MVDHSYWCGGRRLYDVVFVDSRTTPPTEVVLVSFMRANDMFDRQLGGKLWLLDAYHYERDKDVALWYQDPEYYNSLEESGQLQVHEYLRIPSWADHLRQTAWKHTCATTASSCWVPKKHSDVDSVNEIAPRLRPRR